jgi:class 3 adenylate cyclase
MSAPPQLDRRLAAVWFADVVGFTSLADSDEDAAGHAVQGLHPEPQKDREQPAR